MKALSRLLFLLVAVHPIDLLAQTAPGRLEAYATSRGGAVTLVVAKAGQVYAAEGSSLVVYDTRATPYIRSFERRFASPIVDMRFHGPYLYVAAGSDGITKWELNNPIAPKLVAEYRPQGFTSAPSCLDFGGDTLFVAARDGVLLLKEQGGMKPGFQKLSVIASQEPGRGRVESGLHFGGHYAANIIGKERAIGQGIHVYRIQPEARLNFHHYDSAEPGRLLLLPEAQRLLVPGGDAFELESHWMGINLADPRHPALYRCDTVRADRGQARIGPMELNGDLLLIPICGRAAVACDSSPSSILAYDVQDPAYPRLLGNVAVKGRLLGLALAGNSLHCAMAEQGIITYDWAAFKTGHCGPLPEIGRTQHSGGHCLGAAANNTHIVTAEGHGGYRLHVIQERKALALRHNINLGEVGLVHLHSDGQHLACWVHSPQGDSLMVVGLEEGKPLASLPPPLGGGQVLDWADMVVCARSDSSGFDVIDWHDPIHPKKIRSVLVNFHDLAMDPTGRLVITTEHNVRVFDLSKGAFTELPSYVRWGEGFGTLAAMDGYIYVHSRKRGLLRLQLQRDKKGEYSFKEDLAWKPPHPDPTHMAVDASALYLGYDDFGVYALHKERLATLGYYRTALNTSTRPGRGMRELFCAGGMVFVVEYDAQVTILRFRAEED